MASCSKNMIMIKGKNGETRCFSHSDIIRLQEENEDLKIQMKDDKEIFQVITNEMQQEIDGLKTDVGIFKQSYELAKTSLDNCSIKQAKINNNLYDCNWKLQGQNWVINNLIMSTDFQDYLEKHPERVNQLIVLKSRLKTKTLFDAEIVKYLIENYTKKELFHMLEPISYA